MMQFHRNSDVFLPKFVKDLRTAEGRLIKEGGGGGVSIRSNMVYNYFDDLFSANVNFEPRDILYIGFICFCNFQAVYAHKRYAYIKAYSIPFYQVNSSIVVMTVKGENISKWRQSMKNLGKLHGINCVIKVRGLTRLTWQLAQTLISV